MRRFLKRRALSVAETLGVLPHGVNLYADLRRRLQPIATSTVFDVGANIGQSISELRAEFPMARIYSFEPDPASFSALNSRVRKNVRTLNLALSDRPGSLRFDTRSPISEIHAIADDQEDVRLPSVSVTTIDDFCAANTIDRVNFLKIDTEGHDLHVIRGAKHVLERGTVDVIVAECSLSQVSKRLVSFSAIQSEMRAFGYVCFGIYQQAFGGEAFPREINWANCAFVRA